MDFEGGIHYLLFSVFNSNLDKYPFDSGDFFISPNILNSVPKFSLATANISFSLFSD